eukprot:1994917-Pyramimonas_sp.AAC.1
MLPNQAFVCRGFGIFGFEIATQLEALEGFWRVRATTRARAFRRICYKRLQRQRARAQERSNDFDMRAQFVGLQFET